MEQKINQLYKTVSRISGGYMIFRERNNIEEIKKIIPQIQEFVMWFLKENIFGLEQELYNEMSVNLLEILKDILEALKQNDRVLMHDATTYGLLEYLKLFVETEEEDKADDIV